MNFIDFSDDLEILNEYSHLIEYQIKPVDLPKEYENFRPRETFPTGQLLCGDLVVNEEMTKQLEIHPFPEWVVQLIRLDTKDEQLDGYEVALNVSKKDLKKLGRKDWTTRVDMIKEMIKSMTEEDIVVFRMVPGICVEINANVPHYVICKNKPAGKSYPYMQVFEPTIDWEKLKPFGKFAPTAYFTTPFEIKID
ncbi:MAG: hypothetical protein ACFFCS_14560 [Candidatus Hodarchaeota archaeon]